MIDELIKTLQTLDEKKVAFDLLMALGRHAQTIEQYDLIAKNLFEIKHYREAISFAEKCLELSPNIDAKFSSRLNLVNTLAHAYFPERALEEIKLLEQIKSDDSEVNLKKAYALFLVGRRDEAEKLLRKELQNPNTDAKTKNDIEFNLGTYELYKDNFQEGLYRFLIHGRKMNLWNKPKLPFKEWDGTCKQGDMVVIRAEAGIGDEFINVRFFHHLRQMGMKPIWYTDRTEIRDLFNRMGYTSVSSLEEIQPHWQGEEIYWGHSMDFPIYLNLEYKDLWHGPYIEPNDLKSNIRPSNKLKVGLRWQGNPHYENDLHRTLPLDELYNTVKDYSFDLYSLQRDNLVEEVYQYEDITPLHECSLSTFEQTLAEIRDLDIVITSCTSIAHASAAMGKHTIVFTPMSSYYVWCHSGDQSPWYGDNVKLIRQQKPRCWKQPLKQLKEHLDSLV